MLILKKFSEFEAGAMFYIIEKWKRKYFFAGVSWRALGVVDPLPYFLANLQDCFRLLRYYIKWDRKLIQVLKPVKI